MTGKGTGKGDFHMTGKGDNDMLGNVKGEVYVQLTGASGYEMTGNVKSEIYVEMANAGDYEVMMLGRGKMTGKDSKAKTTWRRASACAAPWQQGSAPRVR